MCSCNVLQAQSAASITYLNVLSIIRNNCVFWVLTYLTRIIGKKGKYNELILKCQTTHLNKEESRLPDVKKIKNKILNDIELFNVDF